MVDYAPLPKVENSLIPAGDGTLPQLEFKPTHISSLIMLARDRKLYNKNVSPEIPLALLVNMKPPASAWTEEMVKEIIPLLNGIEQADDIGELLHRVLQSAGPVAFPPPLETFILDSTRGEEARNCAGETFKDICLESNDPVLRTRGSVVLQKALRDICGK